MDSLERAIEELRDCLRLLDPSPPSSTYPTPTGSPEAVSIINFNIRAGHLDYIQSLMARNLSEPYDIGVYNYFLGNWPDLCYLAHLPGENRPIGAIVGKLEELETADGGGGGEVEAAVVGYIAMLAVDQQHRQMGIGKALVTSFLNRAAALGAEAVCLETEVVNLSATRLYTSLGFVIAEHYQQYYQNGNDAYALRYYIGTTSTRSRELEQLLGSFSGPVYEPQPPPAQGSEEEPPPPPRLEQKETPSAKF